MSQPATVVARQTGQGHVWAASLLGVFLWGGNEGSGKCIFSVWQCRLLPNQLDLAMWGS